MRRVGIIGAGAAGLCALRHFLNFADFVPVVWEKSGVVGGTWVYTDATDTDAHGLPIHSSMYKSLRTNLPKEIMGFPGFPFKSGGKSFVPHTEVLGYLQNYAQHYGLTDHIKFSHMVTDVRPGEDGGWRVTVRDLLHDSLHTSHCDAVVVCNGHYSEPIVPEIRDIQLFEGTVQHSHCYRSPEMYAGKDVVVLGASASGQDICLEVATVANKVYLSHNFPVPLPSQLPDNVQQVGGVVGVAGPHTFTTHTGQHITADAILYCTGYHYTFPFLHESCGVRVVDNRVTPLYKHIINTAHPSMAFIGIPYQVLPFPLFDVQVRYFRSALQDVVKLPQDIQRVNSEHMKFQLERGFREKHFHKYGPYQWQAFADLATEAKITPLPKFCEGLYEAVASKRKHNLMKYKDVSYDVVDGEKFYER